MILVGVVAIGVDTATAAAGVDTIASDMVGVDVVASAATDNGVAVIGVAAAR